MTRIVESLSDTPEQVKEAMGLETKEEVKPASVAPVEEKAETLPESETEETKDEEEVAAKEDGDEEEETEEETPKAPKKNGFKKRIDKLSKRAAEAERELAYWKEQAQRGQPPKQESPKAEAASEQGEPKAENFETHEQYIRALTRWEVAQETKAREEKAKKEAAEREFTDKLTAYQKRVKAMRTEYPDAPEVFASVDDVKIPGHVAEIFLNSENGHELSYHMAKDAEEFERICSLPEREALLVIGEIRASLKSKAKESPETKPLTKAPAPIKPVASSGKAAHAGFREGMSYQEFKKGRETGAIK